MTVISSIMMRQDFDKKLCCFSSLVLTIMFSKTFLGFQTLESFGKSQNLSTLVYSTKLITRIMILIMIMFIMMFMIIIMTLIMR